MLEAAACAWYLIAPQQAMLPAWVLFRIFSAMAVSTMLPFVGQWFPRPYYGRIFALLFSGFQVGYLACSYGWGYLLSTKRLHWRVPMEHCVAGYAVLFVGCALWLEEAPAPQPGLPGGTEGKARLEELQRLEASGAEKKQSRLERRRTSKQQLYALCHKLATRWVFWAMLIYCASYSPAVEYSTHVTSYLKEMTSPGFVATKGSPEAGFVCLQTARCEGRYRTYVGAYLSTLLLGSLLYDRASQLDRAFLVGGLLLLNTFCWAALALAEPDAPAPAWVKAVIQTSVSYVKPRWRVLAALTRSASSAAAGPALDASPAPRLSLSTATKTALAALAGASIALPASLPFAIFSLDFGKEGAAVLSSILQVVGSLSALAFLKSFPDILRSRGWFGVHALLALMGLLASLSVGTVMFADFQKFSRGYVVRSSLLNESVVTLHACSRPECAMNPMWRPGQRRAWGPMAGSHLLPYAPTSVCHLCGRGDRLVSCKVNEAARTAALLTPYDECAEWTPTLILTLTITPTPTLTLTLNLTPPIPTPTPNPTQVRRVDPHGEAAAEAQGGVGVRQRPDQVRAVGRRPGRPGLRLRPRRRLRLRLRLRLPLRLRLKGEECAGASALSGRCALGWRRPDRRRRAGYRTHDAADGGTRDGD